METRGKTDMSQGSQGIQGFFESKSFHLFASVVLALCVFLIYSNTFSSTFHFDDSRAIEENTLIRDLGNLPKILASDRGIVYATLALNYAIGGLDVTGYHVVNISIHAVNSVLLYFLLFLTLKTLNRTELWAKEIAFLAALLFAVHPIQTQAISYIIQRMESLGALFFLAALICFIKGTHAATTLKRGLLYGGVAIFYFLSFKSKELYLTLPAVVLLFDLYFISGCKGILGGLKMRWPLYGVLSLLFIFFTVTTVVNITGLEDITISSDVATKAAGAGGDAGQGVAKPKAVQQASAGFNVTSLSPKEYLFTEFNVLVYYITLLLVPANQNLDYDFPISKSLFETPQIHEGAVFNIPIPPPIVSLVILLAIVGLAVYLFIRSRDEAGEKSVVSFFILWFFILLAPTSSFIPILDVIYEHRLYLASAGFFVVFVIGVEQLINYLTTPRTNTSKAGK